MFSFLLRSVLPCDSLQLALGVYLHVQLVHESRHQRPPSGMHDDPVACARAELNVPSLALAMSAWACAPPCESPCLRTCSVAARRLLRHPVPLPASAQNHNVYNPRFIGVRPSQQKYCAAHSATDTQSKTGPVRESKQEESSRCVTRAGAAGRCACKGYHSLLPRAPTPSRCAPGPQTRASR